MDKIINEWNPGKYLEFKNERTQPSIDLVERIDLKDPKTIIDIGCGPGNSTQILVNKYPNSYIVGLDSSINMIEKAQSDYPNQNWIHGYAEKLNDDKKYSLVFSNAALQWINNHEILIPNLWKIVDENGAFAAQIPSFARMPINTVINNIIKKTQWNKKLIKRSWEEELNDLNSYYELLSKYTNKIFLWETHYFHIMQSMKGIVDFIDSTALKPYMEQLSTEKDRNIFEDEILDECYKYYKVQSNGNVLFPFIRMFMIAYKHE